MWYRCRHRTAYIERNITVDKSWRRFSSFVEDMGFVPEGLTLERKDNSKGYSKENCIWATSTVQNRNRPSFCTLTTEKVAEIKKRLGQREQGQALAKEYGVSRQLISNIKNGIAWKEVEPCE